jgi:hypothetical protein
LIYQIILKENNVEQQELITSKIIEKYNKFAIQHREGIYEGNYRKTNKAYSELTKLYKAFLKDKKIAETALPILLKNSDIRIRTFAAAHSLGLNIYITEATKILQEVSSMKEIGILSFNAEMTLKVWQEQGYLKF